MKLYDATKHGLFKHGVENKKGRAVCFYHSNTYKHIQEGAISIGRFGLEPLRKFIDFTRRKQIICIKLA